MPKYNLLYFSKNFSKTTGLFWNYYPDKPSSGYFGDDERPGVFTQPEIQKVLTII